MLYSPPAWKGMVTFNLTYRTGGTDANARRLFSAMKEQGVFPPEEENTAALLSMIISCTRQILFDLDESSPDQFQQLRYFWSCLDEILILSENGHAIGFITDTERLAKVWDWKQLYLANVIETSWVEGYEQAQELFPVAPVFKPEGELTEEEQNDEAFLAPGEKPAEPSESGPPNTLSPNLDSERSAPKRKKGRNFTAT